MREGVESVPGESFPVESVRRAGRAPASRELSPEGGAGPGPARTLAQAARKQGVLDYPSGIVPHNPDCAKRNPDSVALYRKASQG